MSEARAVSVDPEERRKRNVRLAWAHVALALGFLVAFIWAQVHR